MSNFSVLVPALNEKDLGQKLQPFHEYKSTGVKGEHVVFVEADESEEDLKKEYLLNEGDYANFSEFLASDWGYRYVNGVIGQYTNPNSKWDWWCIGGRFRNILMVSPVTTKREVPIDELYQKTHNKASTYWGFFRDKIPSNEFTKDAPYPWTASEAKSKGIDLWVEPSIIQFALNNDLEAFCKYWVSRNPPVFAWIDLGGDWHQKAEMGWLAMTSDQNPKANEQFMTFWQSLDEDQRLYVVDCHI